MRSFFYALLFGTLPWFAWQGYWVIVLAAVLLAEIVLTMIDFVVEIRVRKPIGDVYAGERITHAVMAVVYGAMLAHLLPVLWQWWSSSTALILAPTNAPEALRWSLTAMAAGVFLSGMRDLYAALSLPGSRWPWTSDHLQETGVSR